MKLPAIIITIIALACFGFAALPGAEVAGVQYRGVIADRNGGNCLQLLGSFVVPDKPADDGTWAQFGVSYTLDWSAVGECRNDGKSISACTAPQGSTMGFYFFDRATSTPTMPPHWQFSSPMTWPALDTGDEFSKSIGSGSSEASWWFGEDQFPAYGWAGVWPGQVIDVYGFNFPAWYDWPGYQNNPTGDRFYRAKWSVNYKMDFEWQQQEAQ